MGLGLALVVGAAGAAAAQSTPNARPDTTQRDHRKWDGEHGGRRGGPGGMLLKGINLTDAQKDRLKAIRKEQEPEMKKTREQFGAVMKEGVKHASVATCQRTREDGTGSRADGASA
jgi:Spy/CpxP family protein refolding chaperone